ncbi:MAG: NAD-dependent epimerase/dehydratase family protein [Saprospiraceae bacterium]
MDNKSIFLTGASGLLGKEILNQLLASSYSVKLLTRKQRGTTSPTQGIIGDLLDPVSYDFALEGVDTIIHSAAMISYNSKDRKQLYQVNVEGTRSLINAALFYGIKNFIFISSAVTMVRSADELLVSDQAVGQPVFRSYYAETKYLAELEVWRGAAEGLNVCILNPSLILGDASWDQSSMQIFQKVKAGLSFYPPGNVGLIAADDIANIVLKVLNENLWNKQFLLNAESWTYQKFLNTIAKSLGQAPISKKANKFTAHLLSFIDGIAARVVNKKSLINQETIRTSFSSLRYVDQFSRTILQPEYQPIEDLIYKLGKKSTLDSNLN